MQNLNRKLSAVLSADIQGYSRLMGSDEDATVRTLIGYRELVSGLVLRHSGRVVDSPGDNILAEFGSVLQAVHCAFDIQSTIGIENSRLPAQRRMEFRIGINLGDVIHDGERIYGDGVNVAARMEALAEPGGVCVSGSVYDQIENKVAFGCRSLGERSVKNIARPVRVYRVWPDEAGTGCRSGRMGRSAPTARWAIAAGLALAVAVGGLWAVPKFLPERQSAPSHESAARVSGKASIAVLPFKNLSGAGDQEYFSDGLTHDIITDLSKFHDLMVISAESSFKFKNKADSIEQVSRELAVRYVLEGSVQKAGGEIRINVRLIEAAGNSLVWTQRYVREMKEIFTLQSQIVQTIVSNLAVKISDAERARGMSSETQNLQAYDYLLKGLSFQHQRTFPGNISAAEMYGKAVALDPGYAAAYIGLGRVELDKALFGWTEFPEKSLERSRELAQKALALDATNAAAHHLLARIFTTRAQYDLALSELERALELNPNDADSYEARGWIMLWSGRTDEAIESLTFALRLGSNTQRTLFHLGTAYYLKDRYQDAVTTMEKGVVNWPEFPGYYLILSAAYAQMGHTEDAARAAETVRRLHPFFSLETYGSAFKKQSDRDKIISGLQKAGFS